MTRPPEDATPHGPGLDVLEGLPRAAADAACGSTDQKVLDALSDGESPHAYGADIIYEMATVPAAQAG